MLRRTVLAMAMAVAMAGLTGGAWAEDGHNHGKKACACAECKTCKVCKKGKCEECTKACCKPADDDAAEE